MPLGQLFQWRKGRTLYLFISQFSDQLLRSHKDEYSSLWELWRKMRWSSGFCSCKGVKSSMTKQRGIWGRQSCAVTTDAGSLQTIYYSAGVARGTSPGVCPFVLGWLFSLGQTTIDINLHQLPIPGRNAKDHPWVCGLKVILTVSYT